MIVGIRQLGALGQSMADGKTDLCMLQGGRSVWVSGWLVGGSLIVGIRQLGALGRSMADGKTDLCMLQGEQRRCSEGAQH